MAAGFGETVASRCRLVSVSTDRNGEAKLVTWVDHVVTKRNTRWGRRRPPAGNQRCGGRYAVPKNTQVQTRRGAVRNQLADSLGRTVLPTVDLLRLGWMF
jgi:hypothetical protein